MIVAKGSVKGSPLFILALSQQEMEGCQIGTFDKHVVLSIVTPGYPEAKIRTSPKAILRFRFYDLVEPLPGHDELFTDKDAKKVWRFVTKHVSEIDAVVVHCEAGVSRSTGMAAALAKFYFNDDLVFFKKGVPNKLVYKKVLQEFHDREGVSSLRDVAIPEIERKKVNINFT
jgi:hypothetical protein